MSFSKYIIAIMLLCSSICAWAGSITIIGDVNVEAASNNQFYLNVLGDSQDVLFVGGTRGVTQLPGLFGGQPGVNTVTSTITPGNLSNADLLVVASGNFNQALTFNQTELDHLSNFDGDVLLVLEASSNAGAFDSFEAVLIALGSSIRYTRDRIGVSFSGPMEANPLTVGVTSFSLSAYNTFTGGTTLLFDGSSNSLVVTEGSVNVVPEPSTCMIFLLGIFIFPFVKRS